jgi:acetyl esterase/lipase
LVFIHGGSWNSGSKETYSFIGKRMTAKGKVAVIINYRLAQKEVVGYNEMSEDCAKAIKWVHDSIAKYGGNPEKITISGHSAGAHLCAYVIVNKVYERTFGVDNPVKGCVLIDPFGLDMYDYLTKYKEKSDKVFYDTFTDNPDFWKNGSPIYAKSFKTDISFQIFTGSKTYASIPIKATEFYNKIKQEGGTATYEVIKGKRHAGMVIQLFFPGNVLYKRIIPFMEK